MIEFGAGALGVLVVISIVAYIKRVKL